jgi:hypothetical protein
VHSFLAQGLNEDPLSHRIEGFTDGRFDAPLIFQCRIWFVGKVDERVRRCSCIYLKCLIRTESAPDERHVL